jgi:PASTA domain
VIDCNTTNQNLGDGIVVASPVHTIRANIANLNDGWGIYAAIGNLDGGANDASGNSEPAQCFGVACGPAPRECAVPPPPPAASPPAGRTLQQAGQRCRIPNVRGRTLRGARRAIVRAGCRVGTVKSRYSAARKGRVISQSPRGGRRVRRGFRVNLSLSKGVRAARVRAARPPFTG